MFTHGLYNVLNCLQKQSFSYYLFIYLFIVTIYYCYYYYMSTAVGVLSRWVEALATVWTRRSDGSTSSRPV